MEDELREKAEDRAIRKVLKTLEDAAAAPAAKSLQSRLPHPWDSPGKNTGVGCLFLLQCIKVKKVKSLSRVRLLRTTEWGCEMLPSDRESEPRNFHLEQGFKG